MARSGTTVPVSRMLALSSLAVAVLASSAMAKPQSGSRSHAQCAPPSGGGCFTNDNGTPATLLASTPVNSSDECCDLCTATWQCKSFTAALPPPPAGPPPPPIPTHCDFAKMESICPGHYDGTASALQQCMVCLKAHQAKEAPGCSGVGVWADHCKGLSPGVPRPLTCSLFRAASLPATFKLTNCTSGTVSPTRPKPLNFIFVLPDTLRAESHGGYTDTDHPTPKNVTPYLDAFAKTGTRFHQAHVMHTQCSPSRCTMLTGRYMHVLGHRTQTHLVQDYEMNYYRALKEAGYHTAMYVQSRTT